MESNDLALNKDSKILSYSPKYEKKRIPVKDKSVCQFSKRILNKKKLADISNSLGQLNTSPSNKTVNENVRNVRHFSSNYAHSDNINDSLDLLFSNSPEKENGNYVHSRLISRSDIKTNEFSCVRNILGTQNCEEKSTDLKALPLPTANFDSNFKMTTELIDSKSNSDIMDTSSFFVNTQEKMELSNWGLPNEVCKVRKVSFG